MITAQLCLRLATLKCAVYCIGDRGVRKPVSSGVIPICLTQCNTSPSHRVDQVVDCGLWNVGPLLFNGCAKLLDIGRNWNTLSYLLIQSIPNMLKGWHVRWVCIRWLCWPCKNWDVFSFQELCTDPCNMGPCIIIATWGDGRGWMAQQWASRSHHSIRCFQNAINKMPVSLSITFACPYHNPPPPWPLDSQH